MSKRLKILGNAAKIVSAMICVSVTQAWGNCGLRKWESLSLAIQLGLGKRARKPYFLPSQTDTGCCRQENADVLETWVREAMYVLIKAETRENQSDTQGNAWTSASERKTIDKGWLWFECSHPPIWEKNLRHYIQVYQRKEKE